MSKIFARKSMTIGSRIVIVIVILAVVMIGVLKLAERSNDSLRMGIEDFLSETTGGRAQVTDMPVSELFPEIIFHVKGITISDRKDADKTLLTAKDGYIAIDFWRSFLGFGRFNGLEVHDLQLATGFILPKKLHLVFAGISDPPPHVISPQLLLEGTYNKQPLMMTIELRRHGEKKLKYDFGKIVPMTFKLGILEASGYLERGFDTVGFEKITARKGDHQAVFSLKDIRNDPLYMKAEGTIDEIPFTAEMSQDGDIKTFAVKTSEPAKIGKILDIVIGDLGIDKDDKTFKIDIAPDGVDNKELDKE